MSSTSYGPIPTSTPTLLKHTHTHSHHLSPIHRINTSESLDLNWSDQISLFTQWKTVKRHSVINEHTLHDEESFHCWNTHTKLHGRLIKILACCRHGDIDISSKNSKNEAVTLTRVLFRALGFYATDWVSWVYCWIFFFPSASHPEKC